MREPPTLLVVGTTHPLNIAGVGLDARIAARLGVRVVTVVAGVSAQDATAVLARAPIEGELIEAQFAAVRGAPIGAIHIGALVGAQAVRAVARMLSTLPGLPVVCDPVIAATGGDRLADDATVAALRRELFARCSLITPNLAEAGLLLARPIDNVTAMVAAATELLATGAGAVLLKGGHLNAGDPTDILAEAAGVRHLRAARIDASLRGTGDILACAIAARLAHGDALLAAVEAGRAFVRACLSATIGFAGTRTIS